MGRRLNLVVAVLAAVLAAGLAGCAGAPATTPDAYQLLWNAKSATWDQVQVDVTASAQTGSTSIDLPAGAVRLVVDTKAGKGSLHLSIPVSALGSAATSLGALGVTGSTIDLDVLYDGQNLYAKSPLAPMLVQLLYSSSSQPAPSGDLTGWLKLASAADFASLASLSGGSGALPIPSIGPLPSVTDAASLKSLMDTYGITATFVATEQHSGVNADHVSLSIDWSKLASSPLASGASASDMAEGLAKLQDVNASFDMWFDHSNGRVVGVEVKGSSKSDPTQTFDLNVSLTTPDPGTSLDTPSSSIDLPLVQLVMSQFGGLLKGGNPFGSQAP